MDHHHARPPSPSPPPLSAQRESRTASEVRSGLRLRRAPEDPLGPGVSAAAAARPSSDDARAPYDPSRDRPPNAATTSRRTNNRRPARSAPIVPSFPPGTLASVLADAFFLPPPAPFVAPPLAEAAAHITLAQHYQLRHLLAVASAAVAVAVARNDDDMYTLQQHRSRDQPQPQQLLLLNPTLLVPGPSWAAWTNPDTTANVLASYGIVGGRIAGTGWLPGPSAPCPTLLHSSGHAAAAAWPFLSGAAAALSSGGAPPRHESGSADAGARIESALRPGGWDQLRRDARQPELPPSPATLATCSPPTQPSAAALPGIDHVGMKSAWESRQVRAEAAAASFGTGSCGAATCSPPPSSAGHPPATPAPSGASRRGRKRSRPKGGPGPDGTTSATPDTETKRPCRAIPMSLQADAKCASKYQCLLREQIEYFEADCTALRAKAQGRRVPIRPRQVGIRCAHCARSLREGVVVDDDVGSGAASRMVRGAVYYPTKLSHLYQAVQNMANNHFVNRTCPRAPSSLLDEIVEARRAPMLSGGKGKAYFGTSAENVGIVDASEGSGLVMLRAAKAAKKGPVVPFLDGGPPPPSPPGQGHEGQAAAATAAATTTTTTAKAAV